MPTGVVGRPLGTLCRVEGYDWVPRKGRTGIWDVLIGCALGRYPELLGGGGGKGVAIAASGEVNLELPQLPMGIVAIFVGKMLHLFWWVFPH